MLFTFLFLMAVVAPGRLLKLVECAERTGLKLSTWRSWVLKRKVPFHKFGRSIRINEKDLLEMIAESRVPPREEE